LSNYKEIRCKITDRDCLMKALEEKGFHPEYHAEGDALVGFQGDYRMPNGKDHTTDKTKAMKAEVIIRRKEVGGASNDIGFVKGTDGTFQAIISDYDSSRYNRKWINDVTDKYAVHKVKKQAKSMNLKFVSEKTLEDGTIKMVYQQNA
jgi:uncharacterized protein DUF1257